MKNRKMHIKRKCNGKHAKKLLLLTKIRFVFIVYPNFRKITE